ncbi:hypothetical protein LY474_02765 [Myxococcus stipitatus]|uniref:cytochrome c peroxidase n=1 Tax=Myxococcus stipitatus TaxID=83455 RepID=UPI001F166D0E|nr:cytochrome c peroxidase [Myxococcus stipitatus]MCE9666725.1 hypothetical protein [Myxococcus stipitatus]
MTRPFAPTLLTPDGRLGLVFEDATQVRFIAVGEPRIEVSAGVPRFPSDTQQGTMLPLPLPPVQARTRAFFRSDLTTPLLQGVTVTPSIQSGQGALVMDARYSPSGRPFPVRTPQACLDVTLATRDARVALDGRYDCYRLLHFQPFVAPPSGDGTTAVAVFQAEAVVVVDARRPDTTGGVSRLAVPSIADGRYLSGFRLSSDTSSDYYVWGKELSATADGRLLVAEGGRWAYNETPWNPVTWTRQRELGALYDSVRLDVDGLNRVCRRLVSGQPSCTSAQEEPFARVYPVGARPFYLGDGSRRLDGGLPTHLQCGYTWITPDGTDVFCRPDPALNPTVLPAVALELPQGFERSTGMHTFAVGQHTGWLVQRLDSTINSRRFNPEWAVSPPHPSEPVHRPLSPLLVDAATGYWAATRADSEQTLPLDGRWPVFQFMSQDDGVRTAAGARYASLGLVPESGNPGMWTNMHYWEASFGCGVDPACLLHLPMNELFYDANAAPLVLRAQPRTQDTSGNAVFGDSSGYVSPIVSPYVGHLEGSARFIGEVHGAADDERYLSGFRGTGISVGASGAVTVRVSGYDQPFCGRNKGCLVAQDYSATGFTAEFAFLPLFDTGGKYITLARHEGLWRVFLSQGGLYATVEYSVGSEPRTYTLGPVAIPSSSLSATPAEQATRWTHVAVRVDEGAARFAFVVDGAIVMEVPLGGGVTLRGLVGGPEGQVIRVGPAGSCADCPADDAFFVDELAFYSAPRTDLELAASAGRLSGREGLLTAAQARVLLARFFSVVNPRRLALQADGFPRFLREEDLRIPEVFEAFLAPGGEQRFITLVEAGAALFHSSALATTASGAIQTQAGTSALMSCATCHTPSLSFTDGHPGAIGAQASMRNVPTLVNRALGSRHGGRRGGRDLVSAVLVDAEDPARMNADIDQVLVRINAGGGEVEHLKALLGAVYDQAPARREHLQQALAAFLLVQLQVESLAQAVEVSGQSVVDLQGNLVRAEQVRLGRQLFEGKARCIACHSGPNFSDELAHDTGTREFDVTDAFAYKTPTLWNVADTAPYFHTGEVATLREVLDFYNRGGGDHVFARGGRHVVDPELRPLALDEHELVALEVYLRALRDAGPVLRAGGEALAFSDHGPIPGMSCIAISEGQDSAGWDDNYLCSPRDEGLVWSSTGPVAGMRCTQVTESSEPASTSWDDNFLCVPQGSALQLEWSSSGPRFGKACVGFFERLDPHGWHDNYLCQDVPLRVRFSAAGPIAGMSCVLMNEVNDVAGGWSDNYACTNKDIGLRWSAAGPIAGLRCMRVFEGAEPASTGWEDNHLCVPPESPAFLSWSQNGSQSGLTCTRFHEPRDPHTWDDNFLCHREEPLTLEFRSAGSVAGKVCTRIDELSDTAGTWDDNYLCANRDIGLRWSSAGVVAGMRCTPITERLEPASTTWTDNSLCLPSTSSLQLSWSDQGALPGRTCVAWLETADPHGWEDNHLCY